MVVYSTEHWHGYYTFYHNTVLYKEFLSRVDHMVGFFSTDIYKLLNEAKAKSGLVDLMYLLTIDDTYLKKSINHCLFVVAVGYWLYKAYGRIEFTEVNKKFFF
jgi:hypothetical protein